MDSLPRALIPRRPASCIFALHQAGKPTVKNFMAQTAATLFMTVQTNLLLLSLPSPATIATIAGTIEFLPNLPRARDVCGRLLGCCDRAAPREQHQESSARPSYLLAPSVRAPDNAIALDGGRQAQTGAGIPYSMPSLYGSSSTSRALCVRHHRGHDDRQPAAVSHHRHHRHRCRPRRCRRRQRTAARNFLATRVGSRL
jgi:hypothetical protein